MRGMFRVVVFPRVVKGHRPSFIEDTDTLVKPIGQFNLSQNRNQSFPYKQPELYQLI